MNIQPIKMDKWDARKAAKEYASSVRRHRAERLAAAETDLARARLKKSAIELEDEALRRAYSALAREEKVINLHTVMRSAGLTADTKLPRLAIARADAKRVDISVSNTTVVFYEVGGFINDKHAMVPTTLFGAELTDWQWRKTNKMPATHAVRAVCPQIPPRFRPEPEKVKDLYLLWEPKWETKPPDPDPLLVKPIGGGFFVIVAQWDMTPLEQAILEGRL